MSRCSTAQPGDRTASTCSTACSTSSPTGCRYWRVAPDEINYRRFFDVNELAALSMERPEVFAATHALVLRLLREGKLDGLRIDHPDGLFDPKQYLDRLQEHYILDAPGRLVAATRATRTETGRSWRGRCGSTRGSRSRDAIARCTGRSTSSSRRSWATGEPLPDDWPVHGTSGYDFLNVLNGLFVDPANARRLDAPVSRLDRGHDAACRAGLPEEVR